MSPLSTPRAVALILGNKGMGYVRPSIEVAKALGLQPLLALEYQPGRDRRYDDCLPAPFILKLRNACRNSKRFVDEVSRKAQAIGVDLDRIVAIVNFQDRMWPDYLQLCERLPGSATTPPQSVVNCSIKSNLRHVLKGTDFHVDHRLLPLGRATAEQVLCSGIGNGRVIVKPVLGMASAAVSCIDKMDKRQIRSAIDKVKAYSHEIFGKHVKCPLWVEGERRELPVRDWVLIEEYIDGVEYSIEGRVDVHGAPEILMIEEKTRSDTIPIFRDLEYVARPWQEDLPRDGRRLHDSVTRIVQLAGLRNQPFHAEVKIASNGRIAPIEINPRMGGGSILELVAQKLGYDFGRRQLYDMLLPKVDGQSKHVEYCLSVIQPDRSGTLIGWRGLKFLKRHPNVLYVSELVRIGQRVNHRTGEVYLLEFTVVGDSAVSAKRVASDLRRVIRPIIK